jgi:hypothetical protein
LKNFNKKNAKSKNNKKVLPAPIGIVQIIVNSSGGVSVRNFPDKLINCLDIFDQARNAVIDHFMTAMRDGKVDETGTLIKSKIIQPGKDLVSTRVQ